MPVRKSKIKSCVVLNPPATAQEQEEYDKRFNKALAVGLYRSLSSKELDVIIQCLQREVSASENSNLAKLVRA